MEMFLSIYIFILGLCIGSFLNVFIYRFPKGKSILYPRSFCPICKNSIKWFDNIPLISFLYLKGKCRNCKTEISYSYPLNEIFFAILFSLYILYKKTNFSEIIIFCFFLFFLYAISLIDIKFLKIPNKLNFLFFSTGFTVNIINVFTNNLQIKSFLFNHFLSSLLIYISLEILRSLIKAFLKKDGIGGGDTKLIAVLTLWLGISSALLTTLLSFYLAGAFVLIGMLIKKIHRTDKIPFGPFICLAAYLVNLVGSHEIVNILQKNLMF